MLFNPAKLVVLGLATLGYAHMVMITPVPFGQDLDNSPLKDDGSDFPCKQRAGVYAANGVSNIMPLGSSQPLAFKGSATHGGGSCQISITYDKAPTKDSVFKVIHSIEGGCPIQGVAGNTGNDANAVDPSTYSFTIPSTLPTGDAVLAWTWFNKVGNREMYMNCAPISITAEASKRDEEINARNATMIFERDTAAFNSLPDMFVANINNGCKTAEGDLKFPDPGNRVETLGAAGVSYSLPLSCATPAAGGSGSAPSSVAPITTASPSATSAPALGGGIFITVPTSTAAAPTVVPVPSPISSVVPTPVVSAVPAPTSASAPTSTGSTGTGAAETAGSTCTTEGMWNCIGGTSFQQCASGTWSIVQQLAAGTTCAVGKATNINITAMGGKKRSTRFSSAHVRRHAQHLQKHS